MARIVGALHEGALSLQVGGLRVGEGREGDLGELREVEDTLGVAQHLRADADLRRIIGHDRADREAEALAGRPIGALPDLADRRGHRLHPHALTLNPLARVHVGACWSLNEGGADRHDIAVHAAGRLQEETPTGPADALNGDLDAVAQVHHAVHLIRPGFDLEVRSRD